MVDPDSGYRPRRAAPEPDDAIPAGDPAADAAPGPAAGANTPPAGGPGGASPLTPPTGDEPAPPLFRDQLSPAGRGETGHGEETRVVRPLNFRQHRPVEADDDATTLLPRTGTGGRRPAAFDDLDGDERSSGLLGPRGRLALLVSAVAAVVVVGLAIMYAVSSVSRPAAQPPVIAPSGTTGSGGQTPVPTRVAPLLTDALMLTPSAAGQIADRRWKTELTQPGAAEDAPAAVCLGAEPVDGEPSAEQELVRLLSSNGKNPPSTLHQATAYASPQDAAQAYAVAARAFGDCATPGSYIADGGAVSGLGDQSTGLVVNSTTGGKTQWHSIVLSRTGRVLNVADAAQADRALPLDGVARALGAVTAAQCDAAGGGCAAKPSVKDAPPPLGGDVPGFLAAGDLPPAGKADENWVATPAEPPSEEFLGSQCETVNWTRTGAEEAGTRVYLVPSSTKFGLNDIVLTMKDEKAARALVSKIRADLESCAKRQLTATVPDPERVRSVGAGGAEVDGWTATVSQKTTDGTQRYRVGIVSAGAKVAYTFLNELPGGYDLTDAEWDMVALRAGERMTQVR